MKLLDRGWGSQIYWTDPISRRNCASGYLLTFDNTEDEMFLPVAIIDEHPTPWWIGNSRQNDVTNIHVDGSIYRSDQFQTTTYWAIDGDCLKWKNHMFTQIVNIPTWDGRVRIEDIEIYRRLDGVTEYHSSWYLSKRVLDWYLFITAGYVTYVGPEGTSYYGDDVDYKAYVKYRYFRNGLPSYGYDQRTAGSVLRVHIYGDLVSGDFTVDWPSADEVQRYCGRPSGVTVPVDVSMELVEPPRNGLSYDISFPDNVYHWDEAFADSLSQCDFTTSNGLAYGLDLKNLKSQVTDDVQALRSLAKGAPGKLKIASKLFLSFHYGYKLLAADAKEFAGVLDEYSKNSSRRIHTSLGVDQVLPVRGGLRLAEATAHQSVYYDPYAQLSNEYYKLAEAMDIPPDLSNVWDMIPFSFVVDWFVNIGDLAEGIDAFYTLCQQHKVLGTIRSTKEKYVYHVVGAVGKYQYTIYKRWCIKDWYPVPEFSLQLKNPITNLYHWCEAGALVVATRP